jgi:16S rRNA processing protein RimM
VGLAVVDEAGVAIGALSEVLRPGGANDVFVVRTAAGRELLLPAIDSVVLAIDVPGGRIVVRPQEEAEP